MKTTQIVRNSDSPADTRRLAAKLGGHLQAGDVVAIYGQLGSGKTCFIQGLAKGMGIRDNVTSPTYIIMRHHKAMPGLCHADAYRLQSGAELDDIGFTDMLDHCVVAIEWAERVEDALPEQRIDVTISVYGEQQRRIEITGSGERPAGVVQEAFG